MSEDKPIDDGGAAFPGPKWLRGYGNARPFVMPNGDILFQELDSGMTLRDYFAAHETLAEWDNPEAVISRPMCEALAGSQPTHGWSCKTPDECIAMMTWEALWRARLRYIRADAMLKARKQLSSS